MVVLLSGRARSLGGGMSDAEKEEEGACLLCYVRVVLDINLSNRTDLVHHNHTLVQYFLRVDVPGQMVDKLPFVTDQASAGLPLPPLATRSGLVDLEAG